MNHVRAEMIQRLIYPQDFFSQTFGGLNWLSGQYACFRPVHLGFHPQFKDLQLSLYGIQD